MRATVEYQIQEKEKFYFILKVIAALAGYTLIYGMINLGFSNAQTFAAFTPIAIYIVLIILYVLFRMGIMTGYLMGNAIKVSEFQFPEIHDIVTRQCALLGITNIPDVYIMQSGGALNAFAMRFFGANYVVLYSEIVDEALAEDINALKFIVGHELGHIKRNHMIKFVWLFPAFIIPFLNSAYSRACEYTCDNIGYALCPEGARTGLLILASGRTIWKKVNQQAFIDQEVYGGGGFWFWFAEKISTHPRLTKRVGRLENSYATQYVQEVVEPVF